MDYPTIEEKIMQPNERAQMQIRINYLTVELERVTEENDQLHAQLSQRDNLIESLLWWLRNTARYIRPKFPKAARAINNALEGVRL